MEPFPAGPDVAGERGLGKRRIAIRLTGWSIAFVLLALLAKRVPLGALASAASHADIVPLVVAGALSLGCEVAVASWKYRAILAIVGADVAFAEVVTLRMGTYPLRNLVPLKAGEIARVAYLHRVHRLSVARGALAAVIDPLSDAIGLALLASIGLLVRDALWFAGATAIALVAGVAVYFRRDDLRLRFARRFGDPSATATARSAPWVALAVSTLVVVIVDLLVFGLVLRAFRVPVPLDAMALFVPLVVLVSGLPVTPMGIGVREAAASWLLAPYGSAEALLASALVASALLKLVPTAFGIPFVRPLLRRALDPRTVSSGAT